jgi:hypothetical protein
MEPRPKGDPAAIKATARHLTRAASALDTNVGVADLTLPGDAFAGPARACLDASATDVRAGARSAIAVLRTEAASLMSEAVELKAEQDRWDRRDREEKAERAKEARDAKAKAGQC